MTLTAGTPLFAIKILFIFLFTIVPCPVRKKDLYPMKRRPASTHPGKGLDCQATPVRSIAGQHGMITCPQAEDIPISASRRYR
jgi:uncharacterized protein YbaR (Trm112 family)